MTLCKQNLKILELPFYAYFPRLMTITYKAFTEEAMIYMLVCWVTTVLNPFNGNQKQNKISKWKVPSCFNSDETTGKQNHPYGSDITKRLKILEVTLNCISWCNTTEQLVNAHLHYAQVSQSTCIVSWQSQELKCVIQRTNFCKNVYQTMKSPLLPSEHEWENQRQKFEWGVDCTTSIHTYTHTHTHIHRVQPSVFQKWREGYGYMREYSTHTMRYKGKHRHTRHSLILHSHTCN